MKPATLDSASVPLQRDADGYLTEATADAICASMPKCAECGTDIDAVHYVVTELHKFHFEIDSRNGEVNAYSRDYGALSRTPRTTVVSGSDAPFVECKNGHQWAEPRLWLRQQQGVSEDWTVLPKPEPHKFAGDMPGDDCPTCGGKRFDVAHDVESAA